MFEGGRKVSDMDGGLTGLTCHFFVGGFEVVVWWDTWRTCIFEGKRDGVQCTRGRGNEWREERQGHAGSPAVQDVARCGIR